MLTLLIGRAGTGKSGELLDRMAKNAPARRQILIVPEQYSHLAERRLSAANNGALALNGEVLTFTRLASRVFSLAGGLATPTLDGGGRLMVMYLAVRQMAQVLTVYAKPSRKPAFLTGLLQTLDECKSYQVPFEALLKAGEGLGGVAGDRLKDLSYIFTAYEKLTATLGADPRDKLTRLAAALKESRWAENADIYIDGFTDFTPQQGLVISALLEQARSLTVALTCDHLEEDQEGMGVFSPARHTAAYLKFLAKNGNLSVKVDTLTNPRPGKVEALTHLERQLFAPSPIPWQGESPVICYRGEDPRSEVEWAAAQILHLVRDKGFHFRDIAVTGRTFEGYEELVDSVFPRYGIPVFQSRSQDILEKPVLALITAALDTVAGNYRYDDVFRYLKTGLCDLTDEERDKLENYVLAWDIRGSRWTGKKPWTMHPRGYGESWTERDREELASLEEVRRRVLTPLENLRKAKGKTGRDWAISLYGFLEEIHLPATLERRVAALQQRGELNLAAEYAQLWDILTAALEQCAKLLAEVDMPLDEFSKLFALVLSQYQVSAIPVALDRLTAGPCPRLGYQSFKAVFFLGCDDAHLPLAAPSPGLLTDQDRQLLSQEGFTLAPKLEDKLRRELTIAYEACCLPTQRLYLSYPTQVEGVERRAAFLFHRAKAIYPNLTICTKATTPDPRLAAPEPALELLKKYPQLEEKLRHRPPTQPSPEGHPSPTVPPPIAYRSPTQSPPNALTQAGISALYGDTVRLSASQLDLYESCHFSHFMRYGLRAKPRVFATFDAIEYGKLVHGVLENVVRQWHKGMEPEELKKRTNEAMEAYIQEELGGFEDKTPRFVYLVKRLDSTVHRVVKNVTDELEKSDFSPISFELGFGKNKEMPPVELKIGGYTLSLTGFIDRVDGMVKDGKLYLKVVDYKTGKKPFDLTDIFNGLGLQMLLYLANLEENGAKKFGFPVIPTGVLYIPAREALVQGSRDMPEDVRQSMADKALIRQGIVLNDKQILDSMEHFDENGLRFLPLKINKEGDFTGDALVSAAQLGKLNEHVKKILKKVGKELFSGTISANPYWRGPDHNACMWCPYLSACQFEDAQGWRFCRRLSREEFWEKLDSGE